MAPVEAEFKDGVLRPLTPLRLPPGVRVHIIVKRRPDAARWDLKRLAKVRPGVVEGDDLDDEDRTALHDAIREGIEDAKAGRMIELTNGQRNYVLGCKAEFRCVRVVK